MIPGLTLEAVYEFATGKKSTQDDAERCVCPDAGKFGHHHCGWCTKHHAPKWSGCCSIARR